MLNMKKLLNKVLEMFTVKDITPSSISGFMTVNSGFTVTGLSVKKYGRLASVNFIVSKNAQMNANSTQTVGAIKTGYRPAVNSGGATATFREIVATDGTVYLRPAEAVPANSGEAVALLYLLA